MCVAFICRVRYVRGAQGARGGWGKENTGNGSELSCQAGKGEIRSYSSGDNKLDGMILFAYKYLYKIFCIKTSTAGREFLATRL